MEQQSLFEEDGALDTFRPVHYLGSKGRLVGVIRKAVDRVAPVGRLCDVFSGSGAVSFGFRGSRPVTSLDIQEYSRVLCSAILRPSGCDLVQLDADCRAGLGLRRRLTDALRPLISYERSVMEEAAGGRMEGVCGLIDDGSLVLAGSGVSVRDNGLHEMLQSALQRLAAEGLVSGVDALVTRYFGGVYFSWAQAIELDVALYRAHKQSDVVRDQFLASALSVASDVVNTVGKQFAQPIRPRDSLGTPKLHLIRQTIRDRSLDVALLNKSWLRKYAMIPRAKHEHLAVQGDYLDVLSRHLHGCSVVYADPPYTRDHYSRYYHVLETMALRDEPPVSLTKIRTGGVAMPSRGIYREDRYQSPFCIKSRAPEAFADLFRIVAEARRPLVLSYSPYSVAGGGRPRLLTIPDLVRLASAHFSVVDVAAVDGISHSKMNLAERSVRVEHAAEVLLTCTP